MTRSMSSVELVQTVYRLFAEGRLDETFSLMSAEVVLEEPGDADLLPWAGTHRGHDGLRAFYEGLGRGLSSIEIDESTLDMSPIGTDRVLVRGTERGQARRTGRGYETHSAWLWTVEDGLITAMQAYHDTAAMEAAFSAPPGDPL